MTKRERFIEGILRKSRAQEWHIARAEWDVIHMWREDDPGVCLCGHTPILEHWMLENAITHETVVVGNRCVRQFAKDALSIVSSLNRVRRDLTASLSAKAIEFCKQQGWLTDWAYRFYYNIRLKKKLSQNRSAKKREVNHSIIQHFLRRPKSCC
jgi:hypothetical protein